MTLVAGRRFEFLVVASAPQGQGRRAGRSIRRAFASSDRAAVGCGGWAVVRMPIGWLLSNRWALSRTQSIRRPTPSVVETRGFQPSRRSALRMSATKTRWSPGRQSAVGGVERPAELPFQPRHQLAQAQRVGRPTADVEHLASDRVDPLVGGLVGVDQVVDPERVADLLAVAEDRERLAGDHRDAEPGDPPLVLDPELPCPVDAALAEDSRC